MQSQIRCIYLHEEKLDAMQFIAAGVFKEISGKKTELLVTGPSWYRHQVKVTIGSSVISQSITDKNIDVTFDHLFGSP